MDQNRFERLTRALTAIPSRRDVLRSLAGAGFGLGFARLPDLAAAKKKRKRKHKHKSRKQKAAAPNAFGCIDVGALCQDDDQCCSGICEGKKGKKRCRAHDTGGCPAGHDVFDNDAVVSCQTSSGTLGRCGTTTGNAGYCKGGGDCHPCAKDVDCQALCGPQAACVVDPQGCDEGTVCVGPDEVVCPL